MVTATKAYEDGDEYCDDTGCYPIVCDDEACYVHKNDVDVVTEFFTSSPVTSKVVEIRTTFTTTTKEDYATLIQTDYTTSSIPSSMVTLDVSKISVSKTTITSCDEGCTKSKTPISSLVLPVSIMSSSKSRSQRPLEFLTITTYVTEKSTVPGEVILTTSTSTTYTTYYFITNVATKTIWDVQVITSTVDGLIQTLVYTVRETITETVVTCPDMTMLQLYHEGEPFIYSNF